jgi:hypothetical protein
MLRIIIVIVVGGIITGLFDQLVGFQALNAQPICSIIHKVLYMFFGVAIWEANRYRALKIAENKIETGLRVAGKPDPEANGKPEKEII